MSSSHTTHPTLHTSLAGPAPPISITSGAIQYGVPCASSSFTGCFLCLSVDCLPVSLLCLLSLDCLDFMSDPVPPFLSTRIATPKSQIFTTPFLVVKMFPPFTSLCTTPFAWQKLSPANTCFT